MSYQVLARKWRPLRFDDIVGQDHITRTLKKAVESSRISHAYMFAGPRGCGKTSAARILARVINCENPPGDGNPCNQCTSCLAVIQGNNLDVLEIDGASHTGVAEVRDLQESIGYTPSRYKSKVYIIDEVHMLSAHAFNALLKTLEEPPRHVYFIFATTAPQKIPDTIKSRCQRHHFKRLEVREIAGQLPATPAALQVGPEFRFPVWAESTVHMFADQFLGGRAFHRRTPYKTFFSLRYSRILIRALNSWDLDVPTVNPSIRPISSWVCPWTS